MARPYKLPSDHPMKITPNKWFQPVLEIPLIDPSSSSHYAMSPFPPGWHHTQFRSFFPAFFLRQKKLTKSTLTTLLQGLVISCRLPFAKPGVANLWHVRHNWHRQAVFVAQGGSGQHGSRYSRGQKAEQQTGHSKASERTGKGDWSGTKRGYMANLWHTYQNGCPHCSRPPAWIIQRLSAKEPPAPGLWYNSLGCDTAKRQVRLDPGSF